MGCMEVFIFFLVKILKAILDDNNLPITVAKNYTSTEYLKLC